MVNLNVNLNGADYVLSLPTMFSEVNPEFLKTLVNNVDVAPNYSLVAIVCRKNLLLLLVLLNVVRMLLFQVLL